MGGSRPMSSRPRMSPRSPVGGNLQSLFQVTGLERITRAAYKLNLQD